MRDQEAGDDEEHVDADKAAAEARNVGVKADHREDRDGPHAVDIGEPSPRWKIPIGRWTGAALSLWFREACCHRTWSGGDPIRASPDGEEVGYHLKPRESADMVRLALLKWLIAAAAAFGGFVALMYAAQRSLMYHPERLRTPPAAAGLSDAQESCSTPPTARSDRLVCAAEGATSRGALLPGQRRRAAPSRRSLPRLDRRRHWASSR